MMLLRRNISSFTVWRELVTAQQISSISSNAYCFISKSTWLYIAYIDNQIVNMYAWYIHIEKTFEFHKFISLISLNCCQGSPQSLPQLSLHLRPQKSTIKPRKVSIAKCHHRSSCFQSVHQTLLSCRVFWGEVHEEKIAGGIGFVCEDRFNALALTGFNGNTFRLPVLHRFHVCRERQVGNTWCPFDAMPSDLYPRWLQTSPSLPLKIATFHAPFEFGKQFPKEMVSTCPNPQVFLQGVLLGNVVCYVDITNNLFHPCREREETNSLLSVRFRVVAERRLPLFG